MYSEAINRMQLRDLEILAASLEGAARLHVEWLAQVNRILLFNKEGISRVEPDPLPQEYCPFALWHQNQSIEALTDDPVFLRLTSLHGEFHAIVAQLLSAPDTALNPTSYENFSRIQYDFFEVLYAMLHDCMQNLGGIDSLTGLSNRHGMMQLLAKEKNRVSRHQRESSIAIVDVANFKQLSSSHGHAAGDLLLIQLSKLYTNSLRNFDLVARHAGEKFIFCFPETDEKNAREIIDRITRSLQQNSAEITADDHVKLMFNYGISSINSERDAEKALELAERNLLARQ